MTARVDYAVVLDMLTRARARIATMGWTQGGPARDRHDRYVWESDPRAVKFSTLGALMVAARELRVGWVDATAAAAVRALQVVVMVAGEQRPIAAAYADVADWNDSLTGDEAENRAFVVTMFTKAIANVHTRLPRARRVVAAGGAG